jgi:hypothetical protein
MQPKKNIRVILMAILGLALISCEKPAGPGGTATIKGRIFAIDFDNTQRYEIGRDYAAGERVYIIYGDDNIVGDDVRTSTDGTFEFRYLTKGHYRIFVNSLDTSGKLKGNDSYKAVIREVDITAKNQTVNLEDIVINL